MDRLENYTSPVIQAKFAKVNNGRQVWTIECSVTPDVGDSKASARKRKTRRPPPSFPPAASPAKPSNCDFSSCFLLPTFSSFSSSVDEK